jgi:hypothetical protein
VTLTADSEVLSGDIICDNISTVSMIIKNSTAFKGGINADNQGKCVNLTLDKTSTWNVTAPSYLTGITDEDSTLSNIIDNGNTIYYDASAAANKWLNNGTFTLANGGKLTPG